METICNIVEEITMEDPKKIVQMPIRIDLYTRTEIKVLALRKGISLNELVLGWVMEGFNKENKK
jgi:predicted HicB family RNase H-like nuclease